MINYAVIGTSWITETFIASAMENGKMRLAGVYSRSEEKAAAFAKKQKAAALGGEIKLYTELEALAADPEIQAVYIASPNSFHERQSRQMLEAGKHVICEKPIGIHPEVVRELDVLARAKGVVYMEAIMMVHLHEQVAALKEAVAKIGKVYTACIDFSQLSSKYQAYLDGKKPNIFNPAFATGALEDLGIYCIHFALELFGSPKETRIHAQFLESGADALGEVLFIYPDKDVTLTYSKVGQNRLGSQIMGDNGTVTVESISQVTGMCFMRRTAPSMRSGGRRKRTT
ncbi:MAG: Gfo/Idh/MocA family oxidoreductase [Firmicutes bacterium]|nr:Gfo/Idh/MocA family oxidoreductase [Bacillota bacterium]